MATDLGKVGMVTKGSYNSANTYEVLDVVGYNGNTYIAKQAVPAGTLPTDTTYWQAALTIDESKLAVKKSFTIPANSSVEVEISRHCLFTTTSYTAAYFGFGFVNGWVTSVATPLMNVNSAWTITGGVNNNKFTITNNTNFERGMDAILL